MLGSCGGTKRIRVAKGGFPDMSKTAKYLVVIALVLLVLLVILRWRPAGGGTMVRWGRGAFTVSEEAYYADRINGILSTWMEMGRRAGFDEEGRSPVSYDTFLVLDSGRHELWIEEHGQVLEEHHGELPARMAWAVHYDDGSGAKVLGNVVRLRYWGSELGRRFPEAVWLAGQKGKGYLAFDLTGRQAGVIRSRDGGPFQPASRLTTQRPDARSYSSLLVSDAEYEQARSSWADTRKEPSGSRLLISTIEENKAAWANVRQKLYRAIEGQVNRAGYNLSRLQVQPGPDYSAAHAEMQVDPKHIRTVLRRRSASFGVFLLIDYLGSDVWYAKIAPDPRMPTPSRLGVDPVEELPLEFLVSADQAIRSSARREWIEKGRVQQKGSTDSPSQWVATLPNGVMVTFLGVCTHPSEGRRWWGPDGSPLNYVLYAPFRSPPPSRNRRARNENLFELAWRMQPPQGFQTMGMSNHYEGGSSYSTMFCRDRYGVILQNGYHEICAFGSSQPTLTVKTDVDKQASCAVNFKNISLVPGKNQGFEIEVAK